MKANELLERQLLYGKVDDNVESILRLCRTCVTVNPQLITKILYALKRSINPNHHAYWVDLLVLFYNNDNKFLTILSKEYIEQKHIHIIIDFVNKINIDGQEWLIDFIGRTSEEFSPEVIEYTLLKHGRDLFGLPSQEKEKRISKLIKNGNKSLAYNLALTILRGGHWDKWTDKDLIYATIANHIIDNEYVRGLSLHWLIDERLLPVIYRLLKHVTPSVYLSSLNKQHHSLLSCMEYMLTSSLFRGTSHKSVYLRLLEECKTPFSKCFVASLFIKYRLSIGKAKEEIASHLSHDDMNVRLYAADCLATCGSSVLKRTTRLLQKLLNDIATVIFDERTSMTDSRRCFATLTSMIPLIPEAIEEIAVKMLEAYPAWRAMSQFPLPLYASIKEYQHAQSKK